MFILVPRFVFIFVIVPRFVFILVPRLSTGEVEVLPNAVKSYGAISEKVN